MKRFNWQIWAGFLLTFGGFLSFPFFFVRFPATRDFPWANLLIAALAIVLLVIGIKRAFQPGRSKLAKVVAPVLALLSFAAIGLFLYSFFIMAKQLPASSGAPQVGQKAPDFTLKDTSEKPIALSELLST
ncbi:MAG TPA: hypothetical protein VF251_05305, partial [Pyrinomonadaceae bacterium]